MVVVSAPGKVHLMGEHAVVYGRPALLAAINLRLRTSVEAISDKRQVTRKTLEIHSSEPTDYVRHIVDVAKEHFQIKELSPLKITIESEIPAGYHLGSSAAVAGATVGALLYFLKKIWNPTRINQLAYEAEKKMHGNPSGGDNTAVTFGGFVWYRRELEFLKSMWQLPMKLPANLHHFFLINTGRPAETTSEMVAYVRSKIKDQKSKMENLMNRNEEQTKRVAKALKDGDEQELIDAIRAGERTLEGMGVVSAKVIPLIRHIEKIGGAAKILGGGGRADGVGFLLCYHYNPEKFGALPIRLGEDGIRLEAHD